MPKWFGLDWADIILNIAVLALIPGLFAAYGGHLAAEAIPDPKRERKVKRIFWLMFVVFVLATGWQQLRVAESDLARDTKDAWADALALRQLQPNITPPVFAYLKAPSTAGIAKPAAARSYVTFEGNPRFPQDIKNGQISNQRDFKPGDDLAFDVYYRQTGPNPVEIINNSRWLYTKPDYKDETQKALIADFEDRMRKEQKSGLAKSETATLMIGEERFFTAFAHRQIAQDELGQLGLGTQITADSKDPLAAKGMLRHENVATTQAHYIKDVPENTRHAMLGIEQRVRALVAKRLEQQPPVKETPALQ